MKRHKDWWKRPRESGNDDQKPGTEISKYICHSKKVKLLNRKSFETFLYGQQNRSTQTYICYGLYLLFKYV